MLDSCTTGLEETAWHGELALTGKNDRENTGTILQVLTMDNHSPVLSKKRQEHELKRKPVLKTERIRKTVIPDIPGPRLDKIDNSTDLQVLEVLNEGGVMTRGDLVKIMRMPRSMLYDSLTRLQLAGLVNKFAKKTKTGSGCPLVMFESVFNTVTGKPVIT